MNDTDKIREGVEIFAAQPEFLGRHHKSMAPVQFETAIAVVFIERYKNGNEFGVQLIGNPPEGHWSNFPFVLNTVGLFGQDKANEIRAYVQFGLNFSSHTVRDVDEALRDYIGAQIIPLEWKAEYAAGDPEVLDYIEVFS